jgi:DNA-binding transcriptional MerR regulator
MESHIFSIESFRMNFLQPVIDIEKVKGMDGNPLYKSLPYWRRNKLLPFIPKNNWGYKISMSQLLWLRILDNLRALGYPVKETEKIADYFFKDAYFDDLPTKNLLERKKELELKEKIKSLDEDDAYLLSEIERVLQDSVLLYGLKFDINYLTNLVSWCLNYGHEAGILIFPDGKVAERKGDEISNHNNEKFDFEAPHIHISIRSLLKELVNNDELYSFIAPFILQEEEKFVIRELRKKNVKEIRILLESAKILRIDSQTQQTITDEQADEIKKILRMRNYEEVSIKTRDNKTLSFNRITKTMTSGKSGSKD